MERASRPPQAERRPGATAPTAFERWEKRRRAGAAEARLPPSPRGPRKHPPVDPDTAPPVLQALEGPVEPVMPPGPRSPAAVQSTAWVYRPIEFMERNRRRHGPHFRARLGPLRNVVFLSDPAYIKSVLTGPRELLHTGDINGIFRPIIGSDSILVLDGQSHMEARRMLLPPFHGRHLTGFRTLMEDVARRHVESWPTGEVFPVLSRMHELSTEVMLRVVLGVNDGERYDRLAHLLPHFLDLAQSPAVFMPALRKRGARGSWERLMSAIEDLDAELFAEIRSRRAEVQAGAEPRGDVLSLLLQARYENGDPMGEKELRDELVTLLVAGHETTSGALALAIDEIVRRPEVMERIRAESGEEGESYVEAVVREALRIKPVLPIIGRKLTSAARLGAYVLPRGTVLLPSIYLLHREAGIYADPDEFRPERFLEPTAGTHTWLPFGGGVRRCVGARFALLQMAVVLSAVFERLELSPEGPPERVRRRSVSVAPAKGGLVSAARV